MTVTASSGRHSERSLTRPGSNWVPLAVGPFKYRRGLSYDPRLNGPVIPGTSDEELCHKVESIAGNSFCFEPELGASVFTINDD